MVFAVVELIESFSSQGRTAALNWLLSLNPGRGKNPSKIKETTVFESLIGFDYDLRTIISNW